MFDAMLNITNIKCESSNMEFLMHYREKIAWLTLGSMLIAYALYFGLIIAGHPAGRETFPMLWLFGPIAGAQGLFVIIVSIAFAVSAPKEAKQRADERDRSIAHRGTNFGYYVLMTGMILVGVIMPFTDSGMKLVNAALFMLVIAEAVRLITIVTSYRRGWHG
jgi:hypothetical protein